MKRLTPEIDPDVDNFAIMEDYNNGHYVLIDDVFDWIKEHYNEEHAELFLKDLE